MPRLWVALCLLLSSFAFAANDALASQMSVEFIKNFCRSHDFPKRKNGSIRKRIEKKLEKATDC